MTFCADIFQEYISIFKICLAKQPLVDHRFIRFADYSISTAYSESVYSLEYWRFLFLLIFPSLYITARYSRKLYQWQMKRTELERKGYYLKTILTSSSFAKEVRLFHVGDRIDLCSNLKTSASIYRKKNRIF